MSNNTAQTTGDLPDKRVTLNYGNIPSGCPMYAINTMYGLGSTAVDGIQVNPNYSLQVGSGYGMNDDGAEATFGTCPNLPRGLPGSLKVLGSGGITQINVYWTGSGPLTGLEIHTVNGNPFVVGDTSGQPLVKLPNIRPLYMGFHTSSEGKVDGISIDCIENYKAPELIAEGQQVIFGSRVAGLSYPKYSDNDLGRVAQAIDFLNDVYQGDHINASMLVSWIDRVTSILLYDNVGHYKQEVIKAAIQNVGSTPVKETVPDGNVMVYSAQAMDLYKSGHLYWFLPSRASSGGSYDDISSSASGLSYQGYYDITASVQAEFPAIRPYKDVKNGWMYYSETEQT